jgi:hypothetical protein
MREIRTSGLMRGRSLTVIGYASQPVGSGLLFFPDKTCKR